MLNKYSFLLLITSLLMYWFVNNRNTNFEKRIDFLDKLSRKSSDRNIKKAKVIITGATGMIGEGVLYESILSDDVESILLVNRRESGFSHPKIKEIIHKDLGNLEPIENEFKGYNAVFYCMGISSVGVDKETYYKISHEMPMTMLKSFLKVNNAKSKDDNDLTFIYVTGEGTNENSWFNWAQVKAKTENDVINSPVNNGLAFRPGFVKEIEGSKYTNPLYKYFAWMYPYGRFIASSNGFITLHEMGQAMINSVFKRYPIPIIGSLDMEILALSRNTTTTPKY